MLFQFKTVFYFNMFQKRLFMPVILNQNFQHYYSSLQCHIIKRHFNYVLSR